VHVPSIEGLFAPDAGMPFLGISNGDVPIAVNFRCAHAVLQKETIAWPCYVLDRNFHWTEFAEFTLLDVLGRGILKA
jgi:hypothetical protein